MNKRIYTFALIALLALTMMVCVGCGEKKKLPNVILISIDTLRADHLSSYGYEKKTSPMMDRIAKMGVRFDKVFAPSPWTLPSHASMMTGLYPSKHGAIDEAISLDRSIPMLAEKMRAAGYKTGGFVTHYYLSKDYGFDRGFEKFTMKLDASAMDVTKEVGSWLKGVKNKNFFAFIHYFDPHTPYQPPAKFAEKYYPKGIPQIRGDTQDVLSVIHSKDPKERKNTLDGLMALYDGEIDYVDSAIADLYAQLQQLGLSRNTLIIITSDHGEEFYEHGLMEHGFTLYQEQLHVPMIMSCPDKLAKGKVVDTPVSLIDLAPTIMEYAGIQVPRQMDGLSLLGLVSDAATPNEKLNTRSLHAETTRQGPDRMATMQNDWKYIYSPDFALSYRRFGKELFDLGTDPKELVNKMTEDKQRAEQLEKQMLDTKMYVPKKVWHVRFAGAKGDTRYNGRVSTLNRIVYAYKDNVIYDTDIKRMLISREFPWKKADNSLQFVAFGKDGENGFSFIADPEDAKINAYLFVDTRAHPEKIALGSLSKHPEKIPFVLEGDIPKEADSPPPGGYLIWSTTEYVNANVVLQFEIGDQVQPSEEMKQRLRSLGYLSGS